MIEPEELRIGNYYNSTKFGTPVKCEMADIVEIYHRAEGATPDKNDVAEIFEPLPLTASRLLRSGFKTHEGNVFENIILPYWVKDSVLMFFNTGQEEYSWKIGYGEMSLGKYYAVTFKWINDVHELQNFYSPLTSKELVLES